MLLGTTIWSLLNLPPKDSMNLNKLYATRFAKSSRAPILALSFACSSATGSSETPGITAWIWAHLQAMLVNMINEQTRGKVLLHKCMQKRKVFAKSNGFISHVRFLFVTHQSLLCMIGSLDMLSRVSKRHTYQNGAWGPLNNPFWNFWPYQWHGFRGMGSVHASTVLPLPIRHLDI